MQAIADENVMEAFGDYKRFGAAYLMATTMSEGSAASYLKKKGAPVGPLPNWKQFLKSGGKQAASVFGIWNALARIEPAIFDLRAQRVLESQYQKERQAVLSPFVLEAFYRKPMLSLESAAEIYGKLFARTDPAWTTMFSTLMNESSLRFRPQKARNMNNQMREQSDLLELLDPGAPAAIEECCEIALMVREVLSAVGLEGFAKTSGSKGLQLYVPLNTPCTQQTASEFALAVGTRRTILSFSNDTTNSSSL